ncbi:MAG: hypothetical protein GY758_15935 [Fuerstiella sp.]|nr:hypothetical protein [Fuerstiella sp.]
MATHSPSGEHSRPKVPKVVVFSTAEIKGQARDETYFGTGDNIPKKLEEEKLRALELRLKTNRERNCHVCL